MDIGWVFWSGTIGMESRISARVAAARAGGFTMVSISPMDVADAEEAGMPPHELKRLLRDNGLGVVLDPIMNWFGGTPMPGRFSSFEIDDVLHMSEIMEPVSITAIGPFTDEVPVDALSEPFAALCDRVAEVGARVQLEFMPMSKVTDLATAWSVVAAADRPTGGIVLDAWHFFQGNPDFALFDVIPGDRIFAVQVADGTTDDPDTFNRRLPGDGDFDLAGLVGALDRIGGLTWVGPEVLSPATAAMEPAVAGRLTGALVRALVRE
jgi:sugar phosphate isomerase/epimerase